MKMKSFRFAAVAAVLLALCLVFMAPVGADDTVVAKIGDNEYTSLQDAINASNDYDEIDIVATFTIAESQTWENKVANTNAYCGLSIPDSKIITIDLNGYTVSYHDNYDNYDNVMIFNLGDLTITDSGEGGKLSYTPVKSTSTYLKYYSTIFNCGNLTVNGGTIENLAAELADVTTAVDCHSQMSHLYGNDCILTVNDGTLTGAYYYAIRQYTYYEEGYKNRATINGGTIVGGIYMQHGESWYYSSGANNNRLNVDCFLTINDGNIIPIENVGYSITLGLNNPDNNAFGMEINGGTIEIPVKLKVQKGARYSEDGSATSKPEDATYDGNYLKSEEAGTRNTEWLENKGGFIKGGTFTSIGDEDDVITNLKSFLADGYHIKSVNGLYEITDKWTVTFMDEDSIINTQDVKGSEVATEPTNPTKEGHTFAGWFLDGASEAYVFTTPVIADISLYANWTVNQYTITFNTNGGSDIAPIKQNYGTAVTAPENPTKSGYKFDGWDTTIPATMPAEDMTITAKWEKKPSSSSSSSSSNSKPTETDTPVEPETPVEEPVAGEATVETEVTDGGEVELETPSTGGSAAAADEEEAKVTGVVLPTGTEGKVTFIPISEQAAPEGKETSTKKVFEINIPQYEKGKAAVIKFQMTVAELEADGKTAAEVALWHFDEETGEWTKLVTSYTIIDGVVYFEAITNDFSPFAIVYEDNPVDEPVDDEPETPASPAPLAAVIAALGAAVVLRRK